MLVLNHCDVGSSKPKLIPAQQKDLTIDEQDELERLRAEPRILLEASEILKTASSLSSGESSTTGSPLICWFKDVQRDKGGAVRVDLCRPTIAVRTGKRANLQSLENAFIGPACP